MTRVPSPGRLLSRIVPPRFVMIMIGDDTVCDAQSQTNGIIMQPRRVERIEDLLPLRLRLSLIVRGF